MAMLGRKQIALTVVLLACTVAGAQVTTDNLVGAWNVGVGDPTMAATALTSANSGSLSGSALYGWDALMGPVLQFDGTPGHLYAPYADGFEPQTGTLEVWLNPSLKQNADVADKASGGRFVYGLAISKTGRARAVIGTMDEKGDYVFKTVTTRIHQVRAKQWHQVVMRWNGTVLSVFVDGELAAASAYTEVPGKGLNYAGDGQPFYIGIQGGWGGVGTVPYNGLIGPTRLYASALSETQIMNNFLATKPR